MKLQCQWNEKMKFVAKSDGHQVEMDAKAPVGSDTALTPKQLLVAAVCGCTAMDVVALMKKHRQPLEILQVEADVSMTKGEHPIIFEEIHLVFKFTGSLEPERVKESVELSQTKYCGVSAMISKSVPISYAIELNGENIGTGRANFK